MIRLCKIEIFINNNIYKSLINFYQINVMLKPSIIFSIFFQSLYKIYISSNIIYYSTPIMQLLVPDIFIKVILSYKIKKQ